VKTQPLSFELRGAEIQGIRTGTKDQGDDSVRVPSVAVFLLVGVIWGSEWLATRAIEMAPLRSLAIRCAVAALILGGVIAVVRIRLPRRRQLLATAVSGVTFAALPAILAVWARERISPGLLVVVLAMTPLIAALLEGRAEGVWLAALLGGVGGTALLASQALSFSLSQWSGVAAVLLAAVFVAGSIVYIKRQLSDVRPIVIAGIQLASAGSCVALASLVVEGRSDLAWSPRSAILEFSLAILGGALAYPIYYWVLSRMESYQLTSWQWVATVAGVAEGLILVHAAPSWRILAGAATILLSLVVLLKTGPDDESSLTIQSITSSSGR
jgi:drug/metabolite transporter (DMT)-like permease